MDKATLIARAEAEHAAYPQYAGYWQGPEWTVYRAVRRQQPRKGLPHYQQGELLLGRPVMARDRMLGPLASYADWLFVQPENWCTTLAPSSDFELVDQSTIDS